MSKIVLTFFIILLTGCVSSGERKIQQDEMNRTVPVCMSQKQCDAAWSAARQWVTQNCGMKIQTYSPDYIETYNSIANSPSTSCQVSKNPQPNGASTININIGCGNIFGCVPDQYQSVINFNNFVSAYISKFSPVKIGARMGMSDRKGNIVENSSDSIGMLIKELTPGGAASLAGLREGDIVIGIDGVKVKNQSELTTSLEKYSNGDNATFHILRLGSEVSVKLNF